MYHVSAQGVDERMINVHYYYYYSVHDCMGTGHKQDMTVWAQVTKAE